MCEIKKKTLQEVTTCIKCIKNGKAPDSDLPTVPTIYGEKLAEKIIKLYKVQVLRYINTTRISVILEKVSPFRYLKENHNLKFDKLIKNAYDVTL